MQVPKQKIIINNREFVARGPKCHLRTLAKIIPLLFHSTSTMAIARCRAALGATTVAVAVWLTVASISATADAAAVLDGGDYGE